tara:strand:- start:45 stop:215 length:171 start_codon:yes stop_codon:yes gene_type:complete
MLSKSDSKSIHSVSPEEAPKAPLPNIWKEFLEFWPLSIVIPSMLILLLLGSAGVFD